jgi:hypothetical protein
LKAPKILKLKFTKMQDAGSDFFVLDGDLTIRREGGDNPVWMTGPAVDLFEGEMEIDES